MEIDLGVLADGPFAEVIRAMAEGCAAESEMSRVGRLLTERYGSAYPQALEAVVLRYWDERKGDVTTR